MPDDTCNPSTMTNEPVHGELQGGVEAGVWPSSLPCSRSGGRGRPPRPSCSVGGEEQWILHRSMVEDLTGKPTALAVMGPWVCGRA